MTELWRAICLHAYGPKSPFGLYNSEKRPTSSQVPDLDPIEPALIGSANTEAYYQFAKRSGLSCLVRVLAMVRREATPEDKNRAWIKELPSLRKANRVGEKFSHHFRQLEEWGLIRPVDNGSSKGTSGYFCVEKTATTARSIFNGKLLSRHCPAPDPVNLVDTAGLVSAIRKLARRTEGKLHVYGGDFRHWFHQINVPPHLQELFGLRAHDGQEYQWKSLPMGWSWSPLIAQSLAWAVITHAERGETEFFDLEAFKKNRLPTWVAITKPDPKDPSRRVEVGLATVYYDNFLIISSDEQAYATIKSRLRKRCLYEGEDFPVSQGKQPKTHHYGVIIKKDSVIDLGPKGLRRTGFSYLGVHFQTAGRAGEANSSTSRLVWRPTKIEEWGKASLATRNQMAAGTLTSARDAAGLVGQTIFGFMMTPEGLRQSPQARSALNASRIIGHAVHAAGGNWDATVDTSQDMSGRAGIFGSNWGRRAAEAWDTIQGLALCPFEDDWTRSTPEPPRALASVVCTDASSTGLGHLFLRRGRDSWAMPTGPHVCTHSRVTKSEHIFILELRAALRGLQQWCESARPEERAILVVDNSACAFCLRNGFSSNTVAMGLMMEPEAQRALARVHEVVLVISDDNPADCCSRGSDAVSHRSQLARVARVNQVLHARAKGWNDASRPRAAQDWKPAWQETFLRHTEAVDDDEVDDVALYWHDQPV